MRNLKYYLDQQGYEYSKHLHKTQGIFFPIQYDLKTLEHYKRNSGVIIQRLDGVYYPSKHGQAYLERNKLIKEIYLNYADHIVFQSKHSKDQCFEMLGEKSDSDYAIVYNGVNKSIFFPLTNPIQTGKAKFRIVTTGNFRNIDMLEPIILALDKLENEIEFELQIIGPIRNSAMRNYLGRNYLRLDGPKEADEIADSLRKADIFIYSHLNPPCPNSVLEAISSGLPVIGFDSGAMSELCFFSKELLVPVSNKTFQSYEELDHEKLSELILFAFHNLERFREIALQYSNLYGLNAMGEQYVEIFERLHPDASPISFSSWSSTIKGIYQRLIK